MLNYKGKEASSHKGKEVSSHKGKEASSHKGKEASSHKGAKALRSTKEYKDIRVHSCNSWLFSSVCICVHQRL